MNEAEAIDMLCREIEYLISIMEKTSNDIRYIKESVGESDPHSLEDDDWKQITI